MSLPGMGGVLFDSGSREIRQCHVPNFGLKFVCQNTEKTFHFVTMDLVFWQMAKHFAGIWKEYLILNCVQFSDF